MRKPTFLLLTALLCFLLLTLHGQTAHAAADIQPTSFLDNPDPVPARGEVVYSVVVKSNDIANPVTDAWLEIPLPADFTFVSVNDPGCLYSGSSPSAGGSDKIRCDWSTITSQKNVDFHVLAPDATGIYTLTATTGAAENSNTSNDTEMVTTQLVTSADLQLSSKTGTPNPAPGGSIVTYDFTVTNNGPYPASTLTLSDTLPTGLIFVADNANPAANQDSDWSCSAASQVVTCTASSLAVSATSIFHFRVQVTKATTGAITNAASVSASTADPKPDNNTATHDLTVIDGTDMAIAKSVTTNPVIGGQPAQFTLTATNNGPMSAANVQIRDTLPSGYTSISMISTPAGWNCTIDDISDPPVITCSIASVVAGASSVFTISTTPPTTAAIVTHQNSAQIATTTTDPIGSNDNVTVSYTVNPDIADLSISKSKSPDPVAQGSDIASTIVVHNNGPRPADPVQVVDVLSGGETYLSYSGENWTCAHNGINPGGTVTCSYSFVPLANGTNAATLTIITTATNAGVLTNTACTGGSGGSSTPGYGDTNTGNNCANASVTSTTEQADLVVTKTTSDPDIDPAENSFTYTVTIHNNGLDTAEAIDFRDTVPQYIAAGSGGRPATSLSATPSQGSCTISNALMQCNLGDLANSATATVNITVTRPMRDGTLTNTASAYSTLTGDPNRTNNVDSVAVTVQPVTDIEVTDKSVTYAEQPDPILAGTIATYTIQVRNNGPSTAQTVTLADVFSGEAFDFIDSSVAGGGSCVYTAATTTTLDCSLGDMNANTTKAITVRIRPDHNVTPVGPWQIDNTATVSMVTTDSNPANNSKTENLPIVLGVADLSITKNESPSFTEPVRFVPLGTNYIVFKIDIANNGPSLATGVNFTDTMNSVSPATGQRIKFVEDTANPDGTTDALNICDKVGTTFVVGAVTSPEITCALANDSAYPQGRLASGTRYTRYLVFEVLDSPDAVSGDSYHDVATVTAHETEPTPGNNTEDESTTVRTIVDLGLVKTASKSPVEVEESFSYTLTVTNYGPGKSPGTTVTDTLPPGMVLTGSPTVNPPATGTCTGIAGNTSFNCDLGLIDNSVLPATITINVPSKVTSWTSTKENCSSVTSLAPEPFPVDPHLNGGCLTIDVFKPATLGDFVWLDRNANGVQNSEPGINNVTVNLLDAGSTLVATTTTNASGAYSFTINHAADYYVEVVKPATYFISPKDAAAPATDATDSDISTGTGRTNVITVNYGDTITTVDAGLYQQVSLGDRVWHDSNANGTQNAGELGIPGVTVTLYSAGPDTIFWTGDDVTVSSTTTDASGMYLFPSLTPGDYAIQIAPPAGLGYLPSPVQNANPNTDSNTDSNIASTLSPGIYRSGVITLSSQSEPINDGDTDTNSNLSLDFGLVLPGSIGNRVWLDEDSNRIQDAGEPGIANVTVQLRNSGGTLIAATTTDSHGGYLFTGVTPGTYFVKVLAASLATGLSQTTTYSTAGTDFGNQNQTPANGYSLSVTSAGKNLTADFGYNWSPTADVTGGTNTGAIGNRVWIDHDGNGIQDPGETEVKGVELTLFRAGADGLFWTGDDVTVTTTTTADDGSYIFDNLAAGAYTVEVTGSGSASHDILSSTNYTQTGDPDHFASNAATAPTGTAGDHESTIPIILAPGDTFINVDFGYQPSGALLYGIGNTVWLDFNRDGIMDPSESGIPGVVVGLKNASGNFIATTTTDSSGNYLFTDLPDGAYTVAIIDSENILAALKATYDQDNGTTGPNGQSTLTLAGSNNLDQDFGYIPISTEAGTGAIGDTIFLDRDADNTPGPGEGMEGVRVFLKDAGNTIIAFTFTNKNGRYFFGGLAAGTYTVAVDTTTLTTGLTNTVDPDGGTASTSSVTIGAGGINMVQDFGYIATVPGTIGNLVWKDRNADGVYDADGLDNILGNIDDETPLAGVSIKLYRDLDNDLRIDFNEPLIATTTTDVNGAYQFTQLPAGRYIIKVTDTSNVLEGFWHSLGTASINNNSQADYYPVNLAAGGAIVVADFGYYYQPGSIGNRAWKDEDVNGLYSAGTDSGIANVTVSLAIQYPNGTTTTIKTLTDGNGNYLFQNLLLDEHHDGRGTYGTGGNEPRHTITVDETTIPAPLVSIYPTRTRNTDSTTVGGTASDEDTNDLGSDSPRGEPAYPPMGSSDITNDFGYFVPSSIGDKVWDDSNGNGIQDIGESGRMGVSVQLLDGSGNPVNNPLLPGIPYIMPTDANGNYQFTYLIPGTYQVKFIPPADTGFTGQNSGGDDSLDSDPDPTTGITTTITLGIGEDNLTVDAGLIGAAINIEKTTNTVDADSAPGVLLAVGDAITWTYVVTNTGNADLSGVTVTDDKIGAITCPQTTLAVAESMTCTATGTAVAGQYANIGSVVASPPSGSAVSDSDPSHYLAASTTTPAIDIEKATNGQDADTGSGPVIAVGNAVTWTYVVTNTGNAALTSVTVTDDKIGAISCPKTALALAESMTCTAMGTTVAGQYTNLGSVTATPPSGPNVTDTDPSHYFGSSGSNFAAINLEKSTNNQDADTTPGPYIEIGSAVTWRYVVTNTGSTSLTGVTVTDNILAGTEIHCPNDGNTDNIISSLAAGAFATCTASGSSAIGQYSNTGSVTGTPPTGPSVTDTDPSHYFGSSSQIDLEKHTNGQDADTAIGPYLIAGSTVNWTYIVTNTGNTTINGVTVTDDKGVAVSCPTTILAAGASMTCTASATAIAGQYANIGTVVGTSLSGTNVTDSDPSHYFGSAPAINIEKATNGQDADSGTGPYMEIGDAITWTYVVSNTGNTTLTNVTVTDDKIAGAGIHCPNDGNTDNIIATLAIGASATCSATGTAASGQYANLGTAIGTPPVGANVTDTDPSHYFGSSPALTIEKATNGQDADTGTGPYIETGNAVTWTYVVSNTGNSPLTNISVTDNIINIANINCPADGNTDNIIASMAAGTSATCSATGIALAGQYTNIGTAIGTPPVGANVTDTDPSHYFGSSPALTIEKATNGQDADTGTGPLVETGNAVTWTYFVSNTGNTTLTNVTVTDDKIAGAGIHCPNDGNTDNIISTLAAGASATCSATGIAATGQYANIGTATGTPPVGANIIATDPSHYFGSSPALTIEKATNGQDADSGTGPYTETGNAVTWTYVVENTGNTTLANVTVTDDIVNSTDIHCPNDGNIDNIIATLAVGASATCSATGIAAPGQYANIGTAIGTPPIGANVNATDPSHYFGSSPALTIEKATNGQDADSGTGPYIETGNAVTWTYVVENTGNTTLANVTVTDDKINSTDIHCPADGNTDNIIATLAAGASATCSATGIAAPGQYANLGTAIGTPPVGAIVTATDPSNYFGSTPAITIEKATNGQDADSGTGPYIETGNAVTWSFVVSNTGNTALTNVTVTDDIVNSTNIHCPDDGNTDNIIATLPVGASATCSATGIAIAGQYANIGTVIGTPPVGANVTNTDPSHYFGSTPAITIEKATNGQDADSGTGPYVETGNAITWTYVISNTGNSPLTNVTVTDDIVDSTTIHCPDDGNTDNIIATLAAGASATCSATGIAAPGQYANIGTATGTPPVGANVTNTDPSHYFGSTPAITIEKATNGQDADSGTGPYVETGNAITWTYVVSNTGNSPLTNVTVTDDIVDSATIHCPDDGNTDNIIATLAAGASATCSATGIAAPGQYANIGTAIGTPPVGANVTNTDPSHYFGSTPTLTIEKSTNGQDADSGTGPYIETGDAVTWTYVVSNTGNSPLINVTITDDKVNSASILCPDDGNTDNIIATMAAGASATCSATGIAAPGQYANIGTAIGTPPVGANVTDTDPSHYFGSSPAISIEKATNGEDADSETGPYVETGNAVIWSYVVSNTGNTTLTNVTVTDDIVDSARILCPDDGNTDNIIATLAAGASATCTATGTAAPGQYANIGTATGTPPVGANVTDTDPSHYYGDDGIIDIEKATNNEDADTEPGPKISVNRNVTWSYVVTNNGHFTLSQITVTDDKEGSITCPLDTLNAGESMTCTATGKAIKGQYENTGSVTAKTPENKTVTDSDLSHYLGSAPWILFMPAIIPRCPPIPDYCYMVADGDNISSTNSPLFKFTFKTDSLELLNRLGVNNVETITLSLDGKILYSANDGYFGTINVTPGKTNSFIPIGQIGKGRGALGVITMFDIDGLSFDPTTSILYATVRRGEGSDNQLDLLIQINPTTGKIVSNAFGAGVDYVVIATASIENSDVDDIAIDRNGILYAVAGNSGGGGGDNLVIINKQTGAVQNYGTLHSQGTPIQDMEGLTFYNTTTLYGTTGYEFQGMGTANTLYRINKDNGEVTPVKQLEQNLNGYIPSDFEAVSCFPVCR
ncbi:MAG: DUF11 domain-containing protein [Proteobacteria bacterium]|nr:DUF11 domain-containing protein [Pseudomonadota bacterium]